MKATRVSEHIWSLHVWAGLPIRVWVVREPEGVTLVDAGIAMMARGIARFIRRLDAGPLQRIVLTHGHSDHVGALNALLREWPVPVFAHRIELPYMEGQAPYPRRKKAVASVARGVVQPLPEDGDALRPVGVLQPYLTPGHAPGHVVYYHERDRVLLAGDLFTSRRGRLRRPIPMFTADMAEAVRSGAIVERLRPLRLEVCHGGPVFDPAAQWPAYRDRHASGTTKQKG